MMNYYRPDAASSAGQGLCYNDKAGEAAAAAGTAVPTTGESSSFFADDMVAEYSTDDLFELVWQQGGQDGGASGSMQPAVSCLWSPGFSSKPPDDVRFDPPAEDEMAAWLGTIVKGEEFSCNDNDGGGQRPMADDGRDVVPATITGMTATDKRKEKVPTTEGTTTTDNKEMRKVPAGGSSRRSHHGEAHNLTEKRRRHKINERLKTLQQLVPGCSKSNQASTLDQTIHYMKSLQHQLQAMSVGLAAPAVYPVMQPQCVPPAATQVAIPFPAAQMVLGAAGHPPSTMVPFGTTMLQLPHYPGTAVMMPAAAMAPLYPPAAAPTSTAVAPGDTMSANRLHGCSSRSSRKAKCSSSLCQSERT